MDSKYLSLILRHQPEKANITLDEYGWADVETLCKNLHITKKQLDDIVNNNTRFIYSGDGTKIKAAHGHSVPIKYTTEEVPPEFLYHGTADRFVDSIIKKGLIPQSRACVHMSVSETEARRIGARHTGGSTEHVEVFQVSADEMYRDGYKFYKSEDGVWLTDKVPPTYLILI